MEEKNTFSYYLQSVVKKQDESNGTLYYECLYSNGIITRVRFAIIKEDALNTMFIPVRCSKEDLCQDIF